jgi:membrane-bound lytic murein transglycosylase D
MFRSIVLKALCGSILLSFITVPAICHQQRMVNNTVHANKVTAQSKFRRDFARYMDNYVNANRDVLENIKQHNASYFKVMETTLAQYQLPADLKYLAVVESELKSTARSKVGAVGYWQLMPETAQQLGLKVNSKTDERKYLSKSTRAAALYLRDLHNEFGDWLLVLAAYNSGPVPVYKAIRKAHSRDFWKIQAYLPAETRAHVKKIIATRYFFEGNGNSADFAMSI